MKRWALWISFAGAALGAFFSILATTQHLRIAREGLDQASFCAISDTINCDIVQASSYSEFLGVPIAWWGLCYYSILGFIAILAALSHRERRPSVAFAWFMSIGGIFYTLFLAYVVLAILEVTCIECMAMYLANITLFVFLFVALGIPIGGLFRFVRDYVLAVFKRPSNLDFKPRIVKHVASVSIVFLLGWIAISSITAEEVKRDRASVDEKLKAFYMQSLHRIDVNPEWAVWGNPDAKVTIVEFSEYQCPFCRVAAFNVKPYLHEFKDDVRYYFVNYPLDSSCNDQMKRQMHPLACFAAKAGICMQGLGKFWKFHDKLFRDQSKLSRKRIMDIAESMGANSDELQRCIESSETDSRVRQEIKAGQDIYVTGTPSLFLDGRKLKYWRDPKFLRAAIESEIERTEHP